MPRTMHADNAAAAASAPISVSASSADDEPVAPRQRSRGNRRRAVSSSDSESGSAAAAAASDARSASAAAPAATSVFDMSPLAQSPATRAAAPSSPAPSSAAAAAAAAVPMSDDDDDEGPTLRRQRPSARKRAVAVSSPESHGRASPRAPAAAATAAAASGGRRRLKRMLDADDAAPVAAAAAAAASQSADDDGDDDDASSHSSYADRRPHRAAAGGYGLRGSRSKPGMTAEAQAAIDKLTEDRLKADAVAAMQAKAAAASNKRRRLFGGSSSQEANGASAAAAAASSSAAAAVVPAEFRGDKYARAEAVIHDLADSDEEESAVPLSQSTSSYFSKIKRTYDPLSEAQELERTERTREREAERAREAKGLSDADFKRWQEREAKKKANAGKVGRGSGTVTAARGAGGSGKKGSASAKKPRKRAAKERDSDGDFHDDDDDGFIANDEDVEYEMEQARMIKAAERKAAAKKQRDESGSPSASASDSPSADDDDDASSSSDDGGPRFDEDTFQEEEALERARFESAMTATDAFDVWCRYLLTVLFDAQYSHAIENSIPLRVRFNNAEKIIMEQFTHKREQWVHSATWDRADNAMLHHRMRTLAYTASNPALEEAGCEICTPKKDHAHRAAYKLSYFGVEYDPTQLKHPFSPQRIVKGTLYEEWDYNVGELCHQRLRLYHVMFHFKLHVMMYLKACLKKLCVKAFQRDTPVTKASAYMLVDALFKSNHSSVTKQFDIWRELSEACQGFSIKDTRKTHIDLPMLNAAQDFDSEEDVMELFNWRDIENGKPDTAAAARHEALERELKMLDQGKRRSSNGLGFRSPAAAAAADDDQYELDEEAEVDGALLEAQMEEEEKQTRKLASKRGNSARNQREREEAVEAHLAVATSTPALAAALPPWNVRKSATTAAGSSSSSSAAAAAASAAPPARTRSSEALIDSIDVTSENEDNGDPVPAPSSSARKAARAPPTLPLSRVVSSAPASASSSHSPQRGIPSSAGKSPVGVAPSSDSVFASFNQLSQTELLQFMESAGRSSSAAMARAFVLAVPDRTIDAIQAAIHERESGE